MFTRKSLEDVVCLRMSRTVFRHNVRVSCCYTVDGLCVDTGPSVLKKAFAAYMTENPPRQAFLTHSHEDHAGNVDILNGLGIVPAVHFSSLKVLALPPRIPPYRRLAWGMSARGTGQAAGKTLETDRYAFEIIPSPGHSGDHLCLYEKNRGWLFSGDAYLGERVLYLHAEEEVADLFKTLERLASLEIETIFCGHRGIVRKGASAFKGKLAYLRNLQAEACQLAHRGWSQRAITGKLLAAEDLMYYISGGEFSKILLIRSLLEEKKNI